MQAGGKYVPSFSVERAKRSLHGLLAHGYPVAYEHSTRFKEKTLRMIPELSEYKARREVILTFNKESGYVIFDDL